MARADRSSGVSAVLGDAAGAHLSVPFCDENTDPRPDSSFVLV